MSLRYDAAFYVQVLDKYVATGECAEADNEPLYAYLLSVMNLKVKNGKHNQAPFILIRSIHGRRLFAPRRTYSL